MECRYLLSACGALIIFASQSVSAQSCFYQERFTGGKGCNKLAAFEKSNNKACFKAGKSVQKTEKKIVRFQRKISKLDTNEDRKQDRLLDKQIKTLTLIVQGACGTILTAEDIIDNIGELFSGDFSSLEGLTSFLKGVAVDVAQAYLLDWLGLAPACHCPRMCGLYAIIAKISRRSQNLEFVTESKTIATQNRIVEIQEQLQEKQDFEVCKCETIPVLLQEEYAAQCGA